jgi:hypothetical protein
MAKRRVGKWGMSRGLLSWVIRGVSGATLLFTAAGCKTMDLRSPSEVYYDPADGNSVEDIRAHFNLHRGRWWNYYMRGTCFLAYEHYEAARADFNEAIARRSEDQRDACTYGMHFIDYFPNRERAIAVYLERITTKDSDAEKDLLSFGQAVAGLEKSLRQEESSRAKFYWNRARREVLRRTINDSAGPLISVKRPIYTNGRTAWFNVSATDRQSGVVEIQIGASYGILAIAQPKFLTELAQEEVTRTVEVTLTPGRPTAVVEITATDLVRNTTEALIILDTKGSRVSWSPRPWRLLPGYVAAAQSWDWSAQPAFMPVPDTPVYLGSSLTARKAGLRVPMLASAQEPVVGRTRGLGAPSFYFQPCGYREPGTEGVLEHIGNPDPRSVYQILWLLRLPEDMPDIPAWRVPEDTRRAVYWTVYEALGRLRVRTEPGEAWPARFGVHDVETAYGEPLQRVWDKDVDAVAKDLLAWQSGKRLVEPVGSTHVDPASIDLVVYGELQRRHEGGEEMFELKLRARDLLSQRDLAFHRTKPPGKTQVLADIYGTTGNLASWIGELASTVSTNIPRLQAGVFFARSHWYSLRRSEVRIDVSESDGAFEGMRLCFYAEGDPNRICAGEIVSVGNDFSVVKPERQHERLQDGVVAVTK